MAILPGEVLVLMGGNGVGKSLTLSLLLHCQGGTLRPDSGVIEFPAWPPGATMGYCPQDFAPTVDDCWTAMDEMAAPLYFDTHHRARDLTAVLRGKPNKRMRDAAAEVGLALGLQHPGRRRPSTLSVGELQQVCIVRALVRSFHRVQPIVALDEPASALQSSLQFSVLAGLRKIAKSLRIGILMVLHQVELALLVADRIACYSTRPVRWSDADALHVPGIVGQPRDLNQLKSAELLGLYKEIIARLPSAGG